MLWYKNYSRDKVNFVARITKNLTIDGKPLLLT